MEPKLDRNHHLSEDTLELYALGRLDASQLEPVEVHLMSCATCQDSLEETDAYLSVLRPALAERNPATTAASASWWNASWIPSTPVLAGALAAMLLAAVMLRSPGDLSPADVTLRSERGGASELAAKAPAGVPLDLKIQSSHLSIGPNYRLSIVDANGNRAWSGGFEGSSARVPEGLSAGTYWVRLYDGQQNLLQEYGLQLQ